jgi:nucleoside-diphosphate-sugar epimerase
MRIGILGATGVLGKQVVPRLIERDHVVRALVRRESEVARLRRLGIEAEDMVSNSGLRWTILRGGAFYGPNTGRDEAWRNDARSGLLRLPGDGSGYISLAHVTDVAEAVVLAAEIAPDRLLLAIVDDQPVTYTELFRHLAHVEGGPDPQPGGQPTPWPSFRVSNARAREALGWQPRLRTYRSGFG